MGTNRKHEIKPRRDYVKTKKERTIEDLNQEIVGWFEQGKVREALIGEGKYYLYDPKINWIEGHDVLFVLQELLEWAKLKNRIPETSREFEAVVLELCEKDILKALDIISCYDISSRSSRVKLSCDFTKITNGCWEGLSTLDVSKLTAEDCHKIKSLAVSLAKEVLGFELLGPVVEKLIQEGKLPPDKERKKKKKKQ